MKYALPIILWLIPALALAKQADNTQTMTLTLEQAKEIALQNYPKLQAEEITTRAAKQNIKIARSEYLPQVNGNAVRAWTGDNETITATGSLATSSVIERGSVGVGVSQLITDFGRTNRLVDAAKAQAEAQAARTLSEREQVLFNVTSTYYNVLRAQKIVQVAEATHDARNTLFKQISSLRDAKMKSNLDVGIAKQSVSEADLLLLQAHNEEDDAQTELAQALGYNGEKHFILKDDAAAIAPPAGLSTLLELAKNKNPDLLSLRAQLHASEEQAKADEAANYPTISALGVAGENPIRQDSRLDSNYAAAGISINIPFYTGGKIEATEKRSAYQAEALRQDVIDAENQLTRDIRISWNNMQAAYNNIGVSEELEKTSDEALELTQARYDLGKSSIVDVSQVQLSQTQAAIGYSNALYTYLIDRALLELRVGAPLNEINVVQNGL